jgi:hypothetical protein
MSLLRTIETRLAQLVEGTFGKVFRTGVQPVELARRLVKEMDEHQQRTVRNVYVPNRYDVYLSRDDHRQLSQYAAALTTELSEYLAEHARRNGYALLSRPRVQLQLDRDLQLGRFGIAVRLEQTEDGGPVDDAPMPDESPAETTMYQSAVALDDEPAAEPITGSVAVFGPDGPYPLSRARVRVGRGRSNELVLQDPSVSRDHAELVPVADGGGGWRVRDLGSTNGVSVNGVSVTDQSLAPGDLISFGSCEVRFDRWAGGDD